MVKEAALLRESLNNILAKGHLELRKWCSNSQELLDTVPEDLREESNLQLGAVLREQQKTLGIHWDTVKDTLHVSIPEVNLDQTPMKHLVVSQAAKIFDVLGWFAPATIIIKILMQKTWKLQLEWDEPLPQELQEEWHKWLVRS